jgi:pyruvate dehydrogenase E1 component
MQDYQVSANVWSVTSFNELRKDGLEVEHYNRMNKKKKPKQSYVTQCLADQTGPVIAVSDYMHAYADQIRAFIPQQFVTLGTDGYGRSDTRKQLRHFFEVDAKHIVYATLKALADEEKINQIELKDAMKKLGINPEKPYPVNC